MEKRDYIIILYDYYSSLLSEKQRDYFEEYYFNNLSLGEISDNYGISRNAVYKTIVTIEDKLYEYEKKLQLYDKKRKLMELVVGLDRDVLDKINDLY